MMPADKQKPLVLHIAPTPFFSDRGCHIRIEGIVRSLEKLGYENLVCTYHHGRDVSAIQTSRINPIKNYTKTQAGPSKYKPWADWKLMWRVLKDVRRHQPKVIHAHLHEGLAIGLAVKTLLFWKRIPLVADMQGSLTGELAEHGAFKNRSWLAWPVRLLERLLIASAKNIVCSSEHAFALFKREFKLSDEKLTLVQDGANAAPQVSAERRSELKNTYGIPVDKTNIVYSGALLDGKGLNELKTLITESQTFESVHFLIVGYPTENLAPFLAKNDLVDHCTVVGQIPFEKLPELLQTADIAIDPKANDAGEGSGKMLNYIAAGLPVLAFNTVNNRRFVSNINTLATNTQELTETLAAWLNNRSLAKQIGRDNLAIFDSQFSWNTTKNQLETVYQRLQM